MIGDTECPHAFIPSLRWGREFHVIQNECVSQALLQMIPPVRFLISLMAGSRRSGTPGEFSSALSQIEDLPLLLHQVQLGQELVHNLYRISRPGPLVLLYLCGVELSSEKTVADLGDFGGKVLTC